MLRNGIELHYDTEKKMTEEEDSGHTAVLVAIDGELKRDLSRLSGTDD